MTLVESASLPMHHPEEPGINSDTNSQTIVHRGMTVQTGEGQTVGHVAAVVLDRDQQHATHILLLQERHRLEYRLIPIAAINQVSDQKCLLRLFRSAVDSLPPWHR